MLHFKTLVTCPNSLFSNFYLTSLQFSLRLFKNYWQGALDFDTLQNVVARKFNELVIQIIEIPGLNCTSGLSFGILRNRILFPVKICGFQCSVSTYFLVDSKIEEILLGFVFPSHLLCVNDAL